MYIKFVPHRMDALQQGIDRDGSDGIHPLVQDAGSILGDGRGPFIYWVLCGGDHLLARDSATSMLH